MPRIKTTAELFEEEKKGEEQRQRGIAPMTLQPVKPVGKLTLEETEIPSPNKPKSELDVLNIDIEANYKEYLKLQTTLGEFDTTLSEIPDAMKPTVIANYNTAVNNLATWISQHLKLSTSGPIATVVGDIMKPFDDLAKLLGLGVDGGMAISASSCASSSLSCLCCCILIILMVVMEVLK